MNRILTLPLALSLSASLCADPIGREQAARLAAAYAKAGSPPSAVRTARRAASATQADTPPFYVFSRGKGEGFVIVAGDDCVQPILGVTDHGDFDAANVPPALQWLMDGWENAITEAQDNGTNTPRRAAKAAATRDVEPLITAHWGQNEPYNRRVPFMGSSVTHAATGCVATQGAMLAYYWRNECYPTVQFDTPLYSGANASATTEVQIKAGTPYRWELMQERYGFIDGEEYAYTPESADAVSVLMATLGMTSKLAYGYETGGSTADLNVAMQQQLGLAGKFIYKGSTYTNEAWDAIILENLYNGMPLGYGGGGHAFVLDGYSASDNLFHFNFGFEGYNDGYYTTLTSSPTAAGGYVNNPHMLYDLQPLHPRLSATVSTTAFTYGTENTLHVSIHNASPFATAGICVMLSPDVADAASSQTVTLTDDKTKLQSGTATNISFSFAPTTYKPYNYVVTDAHGKTLANGTIAMTGTDPGASTDFTPYVVTSPSQLRDDHLYTLCLNTVDEQRGRLTTSSSSLVADEGKLGTKNRFAIVKTERGYYLFNTDYARFVSPTSKTVASQPKGFFAITAATTPNRWLVQSPQTDNCLQHNSSGTPVVDVVGTTQDGCQWLIEGVGEANAERMATAREAIVTYEATLPTEIEAETVTLSESKVNILVGEKLALQAKVQPSGAAAAQVEWSSSNESVATVSDGVITATGVGFAAITASCGSVLGKCQVVVGEAYDRSPVTNIADINETLIYTLHLDQRGYLSMGGNTMAGGTRSVNGNEQFIIVKGSRGYYLWNSTHSRFVPADGGSSQLYPNGAYTLKAAVTPERWIVENTSNGNWMQHYYGGAFRIYDWHTQDDGNQWFIAPAGIADAASLAAAQRRIAAYEQGVADSIVFSSAALQMETGATKTLGAKIMPVSPQEAAITYVSSDPTVVTIDANGVATARGTGSAVVTATYGDMMSECTITVREHFEPYQVTAASQITDGDIYTFDLGNRGFLTYGDPNMAYGTIGATGGENRFAVVQTSRGCYLWNVSGGKFVPAKDNAVLERPNGAFKLSAANTTGRWIMTSTANGNWLQHGGATQFLVNDTWKKQDEGNQWLINAVDRLAPDVLNKVKSIVEEYELTVGNIVSSLTSLRDGIVYLIFADNGSMLTDTETNGRLMGSCVIDDFKIDAADARQQWGIIKVGEAYYLYNLGTKAVYGANEATPEAMTITKYDAKFMFSDSQGRFININNAYADGIAVNDWFTPDEGNLMTICKTTATYDATEVKRQIEEAVAVEAPTAVKATTAFYDLCGRRVKPLGRGIYIANGKKYIIR